MQTADIKRIEKSILYSIPINSFEFGEIKVRANKCGRNLGLSTPEMLKVIIMGIYLNKTRKDSLQMYDTGLCSMLQHQLVQMISTKLIRAQRKMISRTIIFTKLQLGKILNFSF